MSQRITLGSFLVLSFGLVAPAWCADDAEAPKPIQPETVDLGRPVDFEEDVWPILDAKCIACHNLAISESKLNLEDLEGIQKGGKRGAAVVPKEPEQSLLFQLAAHTKQPAMPPLPNKVEAAALTPRELGILRQWILEGAKAGGGTTQEAMQWRAVPSGIKAVYSVAMTPWGRFVAAGRANKISIYEIESGEEVARLADPLLANLEVEGHRLYDAETAHRDLVHSLAFSPDGTMLASGGYRVVKLWHRPKNANRLNIAASGPVAALAASAESKLLAAATADNNIQLWNLADGAPLRTLSGHTAAVKSLCFNPQGTQLVSASQDQSLRVWNAADGALLAHVAAPSPLSAVVVTSEQPRAVTAHADGVIRVWDLAEALKRGPEPTGDPLPALLEIKGHEKTVASLALLPDQKQLVSGSEDGTVRLWEIATGKNVATMKHEAPVTAVAVRPDGKAIASAGAKDARLWDLAGKQLAQMQGRLDLQHRVQDATQDQSVAKQIVALRDASLKAAEKNATERTEGLKKAEEAKVAADKAVTDADAKLADAQKKKSAADEALKQAQAAVAAAKTASEAAVKQIAAHTEAKKTADAKLETAKKQLADAAAAFKQATEAKAAAEKTSAEATAAAKAAEEKLAAAQKAAEADADNTDLQKALEAARKVRDDQAAAVTMAAAAAQKAAEALTAAETAHKQAEAGQASAQKEVETALAALKAAEQAKAAAEKSQKELEAKIKPATDALAAADKEFKSQQEAAKKAKETAVSAVRSVEVSKKAVEAAQQLLESEKVRKAQADEQQKAADSHLAETQKAAAEAAQPLQALAFAADGRTLATAGAGRVVQVWNAENGKPVETYAGHEAAITALATSGSHAVASAAEDGRIVIWNLRPEWKLVAQLGVPADQPLDVANSKLGNRILALDFSPDGKLLATGGGDPSRDGELMLWDVAERKPVRVFEDAHSDTVFGVDFSRDGQYLISGAADKFIKLFDVASGKAVRAFEGHTHHVLDVAWKADGSRIASAGADNAIKIWNVETGEQERTISNYSKQVTSIQYMGAGDNLLSCGGDATVRFHTAGNGRNIRNFSGSADYMYSAVATDDESLVIAAGEDGVVRVWNGSDGKSLKTFDPPAPAAGNSSQAAR